MNDAAQGNPFEITEEAYQTATQQMIDKYGDEFLQYIQPPQRTATGPMETSSFEETFPATTQGVLQGTQVYNPADTALRNRIDAYRQNMDRDGTLDNILGIEPFMDIALEGSPQSISQKWNAGQLKKLEDSYATINKLMDTAEAYQLATPDILNEISRQTVPGAQLDTNNLVQKLSRSIDGLSEKDAKRHADTLTHIYSTANQFYRGKGVNAGRDLLTTVPKADRQLFLNALSQLGGAGEGGGDRNTGEKVLDTLDAAYRRIGTSFQDVKTMLAGTDTEEKEMGFHSLANQIKESSLQAKPVEGKWHVPQAMMLASADMAPAMMSAVTTGHALGQFTGFALPAAEGGVGAATSLGIQASAITAAETGSQLTFWTAQEAPELYQSMRQSGAGRVTSTVGSLMGGAAIGALEFLKLKGLTSVMKNNIGRSYKKNLVRGLARSGRDLAIEWQKQSFEEDAQHLIGISSEAMVRAIDENATGMTATELKERAFQLPEVHYQTMLATPGLMAMGGSVRLMDDVKSWKNIKDKRAMATYLGTPEGAVWFGQAHPEVAEKIAKGDASRSAFKDAIGPIRFSAEERQTLQGRMVQMQDIKQANVKVMDGIRQEEAVQAEAEAMTETEQIRQEDAELAAEEEIAIRSDQEIAEVMRQPLPEEEAPTPPPVEQTGKKFNRLKRKGELVKESPYAETVSDLKQYGILPEGDETAKDFQKKKWRMKGGVTASSADQWVQNILEDGTDAAKSLATQMAAKGESPVNIIQEIIDTHNNYVEQQLDIEEQTQPVAPAKKKLTTKEIAKEAAIKKAPKPAKKKLAKKKKAKTPKKEAAPKKTITKKATPKAVESKTTHEAVASEPVPDFLHTALKEGKVTQEQFDLMSAPDTISPKPETGATLSVETYQGTGRDTKESLYGEGITGPVLGEAKYSALSEIAAKEYGPNVSRHTVNLKNPKVLSSDHDVKQMAGKSIPTDNASREAYFQDLVTKIKAEGHDGVVILLPRGDMDPDTGQRNKRLREVFDETQIVEFTPKKKPASKKKVTLKANPAKPLSVRQEAARDAEQFTDEELDNQIDLTENMTHALEGKELKDAEAMLKAYEAEAVKRTKAAEKKKPTPKKIAKKVSEPRAKESPGDWNLETAESTGKQHSFYVKKYREAIFGGGTGYIRVVTPADKKALRESGTKDRYGMYNTDPNITHYTIRGEYFKSFTDLDAAKAHLDNRLGKKKLSKKTSVQEDVDIPDMGMPNGLEAPKIDGPEGVTFYQEGDKKKPTSKKKVEGLGPVESFNQKQEEELSETRPETMDVKPVATIQSPTIPLLKEAAKFFDQDPISTQEIYDTVETLWNLPVLSGKAHGSLGVYKRHPHLVRIKGTLYGDIAILSHELAHHLDEKEGITKQDKMPQALQEKLKQLDYDPKEGRSSEGFAEFMRLYLTTDTNFTDLGLQDVHDWLESYFKADRQLEHKLAKTRRLIDGFRQQGFRNMTRAQIISKDKVPFPRELMRSKEAMEVVLSAWDATYTVAKDATHPIERMEQAARKLGYEGDNISNYFRALSMTGPTLAYQAATRGLVTFRGDKKGENVAPKRIHEPLSVVLKDITKENMQDFVEFIVAEHALEYHEKGLNPGIPKEAAQHTHDQLRNDAFTKASEGVTSYNNALVQVLVDTGVITKEAAQLMRDKWKTYKPFMRQQGGIFERMKKRLGSLPQQGVGKYVNTSAMIKGRHGGGQRIINPLESTVKRSVQVYERANRQIAINKMIELIDSTPGMGHWMEEVPADKQKEILSQKDIIKDIIKEYNDVMDIDTEMGLQQIVGLMEEGKIPPELAMYKTNISPNPQKHIVVAMKNGNPTLYSINHPALYDAITNMDGIVQSKWWESFFAAPTQLLKMGATMLNTAFGTRNPINDYIAYLAQTKRSWKDPSTFVSPLKWMGMNLWNNVKEVAGKGGNPYIALWKTFGGELTQELGLDIERINNTLEDVMANSTLRRSLNIIKHPITSTQTLIGFSEAGPRLSEFAHVMEEHGYTQEKVKKMAEKGEYPPLAVITEAAAAAADVTTNFKRMGSKARAFNKAIPYLNAHLESLDKARRNVTDEKDGVMRIMKFATTMMAASAMYWWKVKDEDWYKDAPPWLKYGYWTHVGEDGKPWRIPRGHHYGWLFAAGTEAMLDRAFEANPKAIEQWIEGLAGQFVPDVTPAAFKPALEAFFSEDGWDSFRERPIIGPAIRDKGVARQYTKRTSELAKTMGEWSTKVSGFSGIAPVKIEHLLNGYTGGMYGRMVKSTEKASEGDFSGVAADTFGLKLNYMPSQSVTDFYEEFKKAKAAKTDAKETGTETEKIATHYRVLESARRMMSEVRNAKPEDMDQQLVGIARAALEYKKLKTYKYVPSTEEIAKIAAKAVRGAADPKDVEANKAFAKEWFRRFGVPKDRVIEAYKQETPTSKTKRGKAGRRSRISGLRKIIK